MATKLKKEMLPEGFELAEIDISGDLKIRSGCITILIAAKRAQMFNLHEGDEVVAKIIAVRRNKKRMEGEPCS